MATEFFVGRTALSTLSTGTTDCTSPDSSTVPVAVLHALNSAVVNDAQRTEVHLGIGMTDGTTERCSDIAAEDNVTPSNNNRGYQSSVLHMTNASGSFSEGAASHNSFIAGGERVNNDNSFNAARLAAHMFFAGCDVSVKEATLSATVDTAANVDPGFVWDVAIITTSFDTAVGFGTDGELSVGFMIKSDDTQGCISWISDDGATPSTPAMQISQTYAGAKLVKGTGALTYGIDLQQGSGTSCDVIPRIAGGQSHLVQILFLGFTDSIVPKILTWDTPTALGNASVTGAGFTPLATIDLISYATAYDTATTGAAGGAIAVGFSTADSQFCQACSEEDATGGNTQAESRSTDQAISVPIHSGAMSTTTSLKASHVSMDADGWTRNWSERDSSTARKAITLAFGPGGVNTSIEIPTGPLR